MKILKSIIDLNKYLKDIELESLGFIPTMGALHLGHISLVEKSLQENTHTLVSIFVNPTQFDQAHDLKNYPIRLEEDLQKLNLIHVNAVFIPQFEDLYPDNYSYSVHENKLSQLYCGAHRKGHFNGVLTVVMKLLNLISPMKAYFGEKDYQQLILIKNMVDAFFIKTKIIPCTIIREKDGLAMSSRNLRLNPEERKIAPSLYKTINSNLTTNQMHKKLTSLGFKVDYIEQLDNRLLVAAYLNNIRLIDNIEIHSKEMKEL